MDLTARLLELGIHPDDARACLDLASTGRAGSLVVLAAADPGLAVAAAWQLARSDLSADARDLDVHLAVPAGDRWTIEELDERILRPAHLKSYERTHLVVAEAGQMAPAGFDRLLKAVEEPAAGTLFWFCVRQLDELPMTMVGRASQTLVLRPTPPSQRVAALHAAGADEQTASVVAALAGDDMRLALAVCARTDLLEDLRSMAGAVPTSGTVTAGADAALAAIGRLAAALPSPVGRSVDGSADDQPAPRKRASRTPAKSAAKARPRKSDVRPRWDTLTPVQRADARRLLRALIARWSIELTRQVAFAQTSVELASVERGLVACAQALAELATNAPPTTVLPALVARITH